MSEHPYKDGGNTYYMNPSLLKSMGINIDERCVVCGEDKSKEMYYVDEGMIHCIPCALKHEHITKSDIPK